MNQYWSSKTDKLIELLRDHRYLWYTGDRQYRNKSIREFGFSKIAKELNVSMSAVKHKVTNLRSKYKIEVQKINSSKQLGFYYKPLLPWFNDFKELMESVEGPRDSVPLLSEVNMLQTQYNIPMPDIKVESPSPGEEEDSGEEPNILEEVENSDTIVVSITQEYIDEVNKAQKSTKLAPKSFNKHASKTRSKKQQVIHLPDSMIEPERPRDEFQMFAEHIAEQLKMMPTESAMSLQNTIQNMLDDACESDD